MGSLAGSHTIREIPEVLNLVTILQHGTIRAAWRVCSARKLVVEELICLAVGPCANSVSGHLSIGSGVNHARQIYRTATS